VLGCYYCQLKRPLHWKEIPVAASPQKLEQGVIHCVELAWLQLFKFGYVKEFLFFLLMPLVFTAQKWQSLQGSFGSRHTIGMANRRLFLLLFVHCRQCSAHKCSAHKCSAHKCSAHKCSAHKCSAHKCSAHKCSMPKAFLDQPASLRSRQDKHDLQNHWLFSSYAVKCIRHRYCKNMWFI